MFKKELKGLSSLLQWYCGRIQPYTDIRDLDDEIESLFMNMKEIIYTSSNVEDFDVERWLDNWITEDKILNDVEKVNMVVYDVVFRLVNNEDYINDHFPVMGKKPDIMDGVSRTPINWFVDLESYWLDYDYFDPSLGIARGDRVITLSESVGYVMNYIIDPIIKHRPIYDLYKNTLKEYSADYKMDLIYHLLPNLSNYRKRYYRSIYTYYNISPATVHQYYSTSRITIKALKEICDDEHFRDVDIIEGVVDWYSYMIDHDYNYSREQLGSGFRNIIYIIVGLIDLLEYDIDDGRVDELVRLFVEGLNRLETGGHGVFWSQWIVDRINLVDIQNIVGFIDANPSRNSLIRPIIAKIFTYIVSLMDDIDPMTAESIIIRSINSSIKPYASRSDIMEKLYEYSKKGDSVNGVVERLYVEFLMEEGL